VLRLLKAEESTSSCNFRQRLGPIGTVLGLLGLFLRNVTVPWDIENADRPAELLIILLATMGVRVGELFGLLLCPERAGLTHFYL
jgi:hypothetical protein